MGLKPPLGLGPLFILSMNRHKLLGFIEMNRHRDDPTPPGRVIPNSYIPSSPQVVLFITQYRTLEDTKIWNTHITSFIFTVSASTYKREK